ncbi:hypothetical protein VOLCADRAFT_96272 [Volvox carteri f. nagariensis]|uniref:Golgi apparatus protein 1 n=1 Tax=Volvox carteri f. nagariensis TaxID=3068 RepID=D8U9P0_VOLCA|nr:uncharacterized protein VOLCADRAFT_96272 [Volvox carteri f. nagariensis]EFJ43505.1 hypothetical protein VOLCADRAFT_96272 [Volvox carteri f. nagariensis]|eukprot:XP_002955434.1 hypothetical protein VOLCADRAFT_96272 [Volvox carteri f. nagariensis]
MAARQLLNTFCLLAAYCACASLGTSLSVHSRLGDGHQHQHRSLLASAQEVSSPDVPLNGACAADIVQHCRHLLTEEAKASASSTTDAVQTAATAVAIDAAASNPAVKSQDSAGTVQDAAGNADAAAAATQQATATAAADAGGATDGSTASNASRVVATDDVSGSVTAGGGAMEADAAGGSSTAVAASTAAATQQQQQQQQGTQHRRRHLMAATQAGGPTVSGSSAVAAELNAAMAHSDDLGRAMQLLGLRSELDTRAMASASAPLARYGSVRPPPGRITCCPGTPFSTRCLLSAMHASQMSISPNIPIVSDGCKAEVRSLLVQRASELRYDPPLLAACAHDIVARCGDVGPESVAVVRCLKASKPQLLPLCRAAVTARQAAAAEDLSLDPELQRSCGAEREKLCLEAGWGEGAAQACLLGHLRGSLPQVFSRVIFPVEGGGGSGASATAAATPSSSSSSSAVELSANCSAALVRRLMEEGEDDCTEALGEVRQLRSLDVRLDHTFVSSCSGDVRSLCDEEVAEQLESGPEVVPFGLSAPFECLRGRLELVRDATCRRHMYESLVDAYTDNRLDAGLMRGCHQEVALLCSQHPPRALECLQERMDKFSREDSPAVLKVVVVVGGKISEACMAVVLDRRTQAATDVAFIPDLMEACAREHATMCSAPGMEGIRALDCLADRRTSPGFSERCGLALREYLTEATRDIRTMAGLREDCGEEISTLCSGVQPGEGRVVSCLRDQRANISSEACRGQVMRLMGFMVEDHRMDVKLMQACTSDVQKYCGGLEAGGGQVHDCLRRSAEHLSPECREAEEEVERMEHEDVRLNPKLMRECPLAISSFCSDVPPGDARVISCLQGNMDKGHFPAGCRLALRQLTDRAAVKYSLNYRLSQECEEDTQRLCPEAVDELGSSRQSVTGTGGAHREETTLGCLARQSAQLAPGCRSELQCDGDVMQKCQVDRVAAPFLQSGYVLSCLAKHAAHLHKPCWELVSTMDEGQFKRAAAAETTAWQQTQTQTGSGGAGAGGLLLDERQLERLAADLRRELEPRIYSNVHEQINRKAVVVARNVTGALVMSIAPRVNALVHTTTWLLGLTVIGLLGGLLAWRKFLSVKGGGVLVVREDAPDERRLETTGGGLGGGGGKCPSADEIGETWPFLGLAGQAKSGCSKAIAEGHLQLVLKSPKGPPHPRHFPGCVSIRVASNVVKAYRSVNKLPGLTKLSNVDKETVLHHFNKLLGGEVDEEGEGEGGDEEKTHQDYHHHQQQQELEMQEEVERRRTRHAAVAGAARHRGKPSRGRRNRTGGAAAGKAASELSELSQLATSEGATQDEQGQGQGAAEGVDGKGEVVMGHGAELQPQPQVPEQQQQKQDLQGELDEHRLEVEEGGATHATGEQHLGEAAAAESGGPVNLAEGGRRWSNRGEEQQEQEQLGGQEGQANEPAPPPKLGAQGTVAPAQAVREEAVKEKATEQGQPEETKASSEMKRGLKRLHSATAGEMVDGMQAKRRRVDAHGNEKDGGMVVEMVIEEDVPMEEWEEAGDLEVGGGADALLTRSFSLINFPVRERVGDWTLERRRDVQFGGLEGMDESGQAQSMRGAKALS